MKILKHDFSLKCLWGILGFILIGGIYFLSLADVDEVVVKESKNFFEYVFLIRDVKDIKEEHFKKAVKNVALYPDFKRTLTLIEQRSRLISFLFKGMMEDELSLSYKKLSFLVRQMPESSKISKSIFQHNLITPYKEVLDNYGVTL